LPGRTPEGPPYDAVMTSLPRLAALAAVALLAAAAVYWWLGRAPEPPAPAPVAVAPPPAEPAASAPPAIRHPVDALAAASEPAAAPATRSEALTALLGRKAVLSFMQTDDFPRRVAATVDNLGRNHAAPALWPVNPVPGRFTVRGKGDAMIVDPDNGARYTPFVLLVESVDAERAVALYASHYAQFQQAYEELGYPGRYFNDRLVEVIDQLLATPTADATPEVVLTEVKGPVATARPWVRYEFADPKLESLSAGQKMLLRSGPVNQRRLKAKLTEFRRHLTTLR
jgi:hypothetical protein